jgi:hypothetical protein
MTWIRWPNGYVAKEGHYSIRKVHGHRKGNQVVWEPHGPGIRVGAAYDLLWKAKAACEEARKEQP